MKMIIVSMLSLTVGFSAGYLYPRKIISSKRLGDFNVQDLKHLEVSDNDNFVSRNEWTIIVNPIDSSLSLIKNDEKADIMYKLFPNQLTDTVKAYRIKLFSE